jgi:hypothetical protein
MGAADGDDQGMSAMKLTDLDACFIKLTDERGSHRTDASFDDCDGISFLCPKCYAANNGPVGTHTVICWKPHVPQTISPKQGRWNFRGTGMHDLTLFAGSSSILLTGGCAWHGFVGFGGVPPGHAA